MEKFKFLTIFICLSFGQLLYASGRKIPKIFEKNWTAKSVFFGVNQAWDYVPQKKTIMTFYSREKFKPFELNNFPKEKYHEYLTKMRTLGLKFIGISDWKIKKMKIKKLGKEKILIKVSGTYKKESGLVRFSEWQIFDGYLYSQINLIEEVSPKTKYVTELERDQLFKKVLRL